MNLTRYNYLVRLGGNKQLDDMRVVIHVYIAVSDDLQFCLPTVFLNALIIPLTSPVLVRPGYAALKAALISGTHGMQLRGAEFDEVYIAAL